MITEAKMHDVFGGFSLDMARYEFRRGGDVAPLRSQVSMSSPIW
jgi:hypothetical protein